MAGDAHDRPPSCARCRELERILLMVADRIEAQEQANLYMAALKPDIRTSLLALGTPPEDMGRR